MELRDIVSWGGLSIQLITVIVAWYHFPKKVRIAWKVFVLIWTVTFIVEAAGKIMGMYRMNNHWLYNLLYTLFYPGIVFFYSIVFKAGPLKWVVMFGSLCLLIAQTLSILMSGIGTLNTPYTIAGSFLILFLSISYFVSLFVDTDNATSLYTDPYYWFSIGFILYFAYFTVLIGMYNTVIKSNVAWLRHFTFYAGHVVTVILHLCLWFGFRAGRLWTK